VNGLTAKTRIREAAMELFAEVGYAKEVGLSGTSRPAASSKPNAGVQRSDTYFPVLSRVPASSAACYRASIWSLRPSYVCWYPAMEIRRSDPVGITRSPIGPIA
jgi:hypothetical protein